MSDESNGPSLLEVSQAIFNITSSIIELKTASVLTQENIDKANEVLGIFLGKVEDAVKTINLVDQPAS